ncbi:hypothetical protein, variant 1 [Phytophthora nicotianae P10297]|uniref:Palmitoyltransferase n=1 Tax=Phytophthora nicotianae P10297 TaxID=1317064 RepID=W2Y6L7_PHYNI|nr:hypothetical protein, variant 1 [Phytophthora nicotianae P10297]
MARNRNVENPVRSATLRKWYARAWWVGVHVYGYVVLGVKGALSPQALPTGQFVVYLVVAVAAILCYVVLQCSSPGQLDKRPMLAPVQTTTPTELGSSPRMATEDDDDTELLGDGEENEHQGSSTDLHFCNECHVFQPLRTKHCKDCARCTRQYDHHCDCVGTCVGENNRLVRVVLVPADSGRCGDDRCDIRGFHGARRRQRLVQGQRAYLISTNQTSWEHARRSSITYLQNLPDKRSPFDRGVLQNWWVFLSNGDSNKWVHQSVAKPMTSHPDDSSSLV